MFSVPITQGFCKEISILNLLVLIAILAGGFSLCTATTLGVAIDGSQTYTSIQEAISASAHGDTVLVYPGRYQENISFMGKNITLASLELLSGDLQYKYNTILDGAQSGSVILIISQERNVHIRGFTITNGSGNYYSQHDASFGGGIIITSMQAPHQVKITNCLITGNIAGQGGGVFAGQCHLSLSGTTIKGNTAVFGGGVDVHDIYVPRYSITFDPVNRCSIYCNKGASGCDMRFYLQNQIHVVVDTFTVATPSNFYVASDPTSTSIPYPVTFDILNSVHQEINSDLYVAPWGDDNNSGLTESCPLRTIFQAVYNIASDPSDPKTIYLAAGYYSKSANQQFYPLSLKSSTRITGSSKEETVLDMESSSSGFLISPFTDDIGIENLSIINCKSGISLNRSHNVRINEVNIKNAIHLVSLGGSYGVTGNRGINASLTSLSIQDVYSNYFCYGIALFSHNGTAKIYNADISGITSPRSLMAIDVDSRISADVVIDACRIHDNNCSDPESWNTIFQVAPFDESTEHLGLRISNSAFYNNRQSYSEAMSYARAINDTAYIRNCSFAGNSGGNTALRVLGNVVLENNIFWNPQLAKEVEIYYGQYSGFSHVEFINNCIRGGQNGIYNVHPLNPVIWHSNNTAVDPQFAGDGNAPYRLSALSPLIDAGMHAFSEVNTKDAGGNERYYDGDGDGVAQIDIGAYEYQPIDFPTDLIAEQWQQAIYLSWQMSTSQRGLSGYRIYRNNAIYADILDPSQRYFRDYSSVNDTLSYCVVALYGNVESPPSNIQVVIIDDVGNADELAPPLISDVIVSPNPFRDIAVINYALGKELKLEIKIYNLKGQLVKTLCEGIQSKGEQVLAWDGCDDKGRFLASGIYLLQVKLDKTAQKPMKIVKLK